MLYALTASSFQHRNNFLHVPVPSQSVTATPNPYRFAIGPSPSPESARVPGKVVTSRFIGDWEPDDKLSARLTSFRQFSLPDMRVVLFR